MFQRLGGHVVEVDEVAARVHEGEEERRARANLERKKSEGKGGKMVIRPPKKGEVELC